VEEARTLIDKGVDSLTDLENKRLNRLLLSTALRRDIAMPGATQLDFYYFTWHWSAFTVNISHAEFASGITSQLPGFFDKFVVSIGIFIAILVTSSFIPEMLEAGSLNLLLSKPVHRWGLLLAKFAGGCVFIFLCAALFFTGVYFWMGIQLGIWERAILLSIPVYVLVFAMYYSVSVLAGILFRSPILCITFAILFWAACFVTGYVYGLFDYRFYNNAPYQLAVHDEDVAMVDLLQSHLVWDRSRREWRNPVQRRDASPEEQSFAVAAWFDRLDTLPDLPGPVFDRDANKLLLVNGGISDVVTNATLKLSAANAGENWSVSDRGRLPAGTAALLWSPRFGQLVVDKAGIVFRWEGTDEEIPADENEEATGETSDDGENNGKQKSNGLTDAISGLLTRASDDLPYERISEVNNLELRSPSAISLNPDNDHIAMYSNGQLIILAPDDEGQYVQRAEAAIGEHENSRMAVWVKYRGDKLFVVLGNGRFYHVQPDDLSVVHTETIDNRAAVRDLSASPDGRYAAINLRDGRLHVYDAESQDQWNAAALAQGDILAAAFDDQGRLWIGDRFRGTQRYDMDSGSQLDSRQSDGGWMTSAFRYGIRPLYRIFPKPGEFYKVISHLSSATDAGDNPDIDLTRLPHRDDPWSPLRSGLFFMVLMLAISCFIFQRQDF
ncbi:MAG: ABC transporter permease subunit, partial [Pirellulaceae bacterium]